MPRNGSGVYGPPAGTAAVPNTTIESADYNAVVADIAQALTDSVNVQGTAPFLASQPMGGNKFTGLGTGSAAADSATVGQIQADLVAHATAVGGTADGITATFSPAFTAYTAKMRFRFTAGAANTATAPTINIDGLGAKMIKKLNAVALAPGDISGSGHVCDCVYNGTDVILLNFAPVAIDREQTFTAKQTFSKPLIKTVETLTDAATIAWDMNARPNNVRVLLTASRNLGLPTNLNTGQSGLVIVQQDGTGGWSLTLNAIFKISIVDLEKAANAKTVFAYDVIEDHTAAKVILLRRLWSEGKSTLGFWKEYDKGTFTQSTDITQAHGLGRYPSLIQAYLQCTSSDLGFAVGQRLDVGSIADGSTGGRAPSLYMDTTSVGLRTGQGTPIVIDASASYVGNLIDISKWKVILRVYE